MVSGRVVLRKEPGKILPFSRTRLPFVPNNKTLIMTAFGVNKDVLAANCRKCCCCLLLPLKPHSKGINITG